MAATGHDHSTFYCCCCWGGGGGNNVNLLNDIPWGYLKDLQGIVLGRQGNVLDYYFHSKKQKSIMPLRMSFWSDMYVLSLLPRVELKKTWVL